MLQLTIPGIEYYDENTETFIQTKGQTLQLEHSLVSVSKWESKWKKPFLGTEPRTYEESVDYIRCMTLTQNVSPEIYNNITRDIFEEVNRYIDDPMTATWFNKRAGGRGGRQVTTSEVIYYWLVALNIPFEVQKWHLNRLFTLVQVCNAKNAPEKKMSKKQTLQNNREINAARRQSIGTKG